MSPMKEIPALIKRLQNALNMSDMIGLMEVPAALIKQGAAAVEPLLAAVDQSVLPMDDVRRLLKDIGPRLSAEEKLHVLAAAQHHAEQGQSVTSRVMALELLADYADSASHRGLGLLALARDVRVPIEVRHAALRAIVRVPLDRLGARALLELVNDAEPGIAAFALDAVERHEDQLEHSAVKPLLLRLLTNPHRDVRCRAIELLGHFGEVDVVDHICALPHPEPHDLAAVQRMVGRVLSKPRSLLHVSPTSFEHLVMRLLQSMGYEDVKVTGGVSDGGIDLTAIREEAKGGFATQRLRYVVQCKRHRGAIGPRMVQEFVDILRGQEGLFIATTTFTEEARKASELAKLRLVDRDALQLLLDQHFGPNSYRIAVAA